MALSTEEVLAGLAELINDETGIATDSVELGKSFTDDLDIDSISMMMSKVVVVTMGPFLKHI